MYRFLKVFTASFTPKTSLIREDLPTPDLPRTKIRKRGQYFRTSWTEDGSSEYGLSVDGDESKTGTVVGCVSCACSVAVCPDWICVPEFETTTLWIAGSCIAISGALGIYIGWRVIRMHLRVNLKGPSAFSVATWIYSLPLRKLPRPEPTNKWEKNQSRVKSLWWYKCWPQILALIDGWPWTIDGMPRVLNMLCCAYHESGCCFTTRRKRTRRKAFAESDAPTAICLVRERGVSMFEQRTYRHHV
jgi:hypothetical protein